MPIKLKTISVTESSNPLQEHLNNVLSLAKEKIEYAEKKLKAACAAADLIKENSDIPEKSSRNSDPLKTAAAKDNLTILSAAIDKTGPINQKDQQTIREYLSSLDHLRKENQLVYEKKLKLLSTNNRTYCGEQYAIQVGAVEFGVTYDNEIFIIPTSKDAANNLYKMAQGALLKAIGCLQIEKEEIDRAVNGVSSKKIVGQIKFISVYNAFFDAPKDNIAVSLFFLQSLGIDLDATKVVIPNDNAPLITHTDPDCRIVIHGEMKNAVDYLDETRFPGAKALAEKNLTFFDKLDELFCSIDDEIFLKRNKRFIQEIYEEKELLKLNLIKLFNCAEALIKDTEKKTKVAKIEAGLQEDSNQPSTSRQTIARQNSVSQTTMVEEQTGSFNNYWQCIKESTQLFKEKNIDLIFLFPEINMVLAYILQNGLTFEEKKQLKFEELTSTQKILGSLTIKEKEQLDELKKLMFIQKISGRIVDRENISPYIAFYEQNPIKTCIALLKDYSKGDGWLGIIYRFFSGAWNRNYKEPVNKFLSVYDKNELPDNINICGIYEKLKDSGLMFNYDAENKSSLRKILLFCAKLNKEEESLLHLIHNLSLTSFPPPDQDRQIDCCC